MPKHLLSILVLFLCLAPAMPLRADIRLPNDSPVANRVRPVIRLLPAGWIREISPNERVNPPEFLSSLYPGQKIALAVVADGPDRDKLLSGLRIQVRITSPRNGTAEFRNLQPQAIRKIKAEGADMALLMISGGGISKQEREAIEKSTSLVSFAVFIPDWTVPFADRSETLQVSVSVTGDPSSPSIDALSVPLKASADWLKEAPVGRQEISNFLHRYHEDIAPGMLLFMLRSAALIDDMRQSALSGYFTIAYRENRGARAEAIRLFPSLDAKTRGALALVFRLGGLDVGTLLPGLPPESLAALRLVEPLKDPRRLLDFKDPIAPEELRRVGGIMDGCWDGWMATGDSSYLRALVDLLGAAPDFPVFQAWAKSRSGAKGINAQVARGLAYQIAGWSIGSFQRADHHVADWLEFWEKDPSVSASLRKEIAALPNNPNFRRK
jgi:hypothetical protein